MAERYLTWDRASPAAARLLETLILAASIQAQHQPQAGLRVEEAVVDVVLPLAQRGEGQLLSALQALLPSGRTPRPLFCDGSSLPWGALVMEWLRWGAAPEGRRTRTRSAGPGASGCQYSSAAPAGPPA